MAEKYYRDKNCDLDDLFKDSEAWFQQRKYQIQSDHSDGKWLIQARQAETWRMAVGATRAFNLLIQGQPNDFSVTLSIGEWATNLAAGGVAAVLTAGHSIVISGITAGWSKKIEADLWNFLDQRVMFGGKVKSAEEQSQSILVEKLNRLKDAYEHGFIDTAAYNAKKLEIESQSRAADEGAATQAKLLKLKNLLDEGILTQDEFDVKTAELTRESSNSESDVLTSNLDAALAAGILSQEEYESKKAARERQSELDRKIKQLESARDAEIITTEEFEAKKQALFAQ